MRSWISLALLLIVVAALGAWVYYKPAPAQTATHALSTLTASGVRRARLERVPVRPAAGPAEASVATAAAVTSIALERSGEQWRLTAPLAARADPFQVDRLLSILKARASVRYPATDLARFGLEQPLATLIVDDQAFSFGAINKTTREQYVMTAGAVYPVALAYVAALPRDADALLARQLLAGGEIPVRFDLPGFTVALEQGTWAVAPPAPGLSADERNAWVEGWRQASAMSVAAYRGEAPAQAITVTLKDGRTLQLGIARLEPELVLVRADEGVQYQFVQDVAKRLLSPPGAGRSADAPTR